MLTKLIQRLPKRTRFLSAVLFASAIGALVAQESPPAPDETPAPPVGAQQIEEARKALREAMQNGGAPGATPAPTTPAPAPATPAATKVVTPVTPAAATPAPAVPAPGTPAPASRAVRTAQPAQNTAVPGFPAAPGGGPQPNVTGQAGNQAPIPLPGAPGLPGQPGQAPAAAVPVIDGAADIIPAGQLQIHKMPPEQFFEIYSMVSGRTVIRPEMIQGASQGITLKAQSDWTRQEAVYAMDAVLALNGIAMIPVGDKFIKAVASPNAPTEGSELLAGDAQQLGGLEQFVTKVITVETIKPSELAQMVATFSKTPNWITPFDNNQTVVLRDYASNVKRTMDVIKQIDVMRESDYKLEVLPIKYGKVIDLYNTMSSLVSGSGGGGAAGSTAGTTGSTLNQGGGTMMQRQQGGRFGSSSSSRYGNSGYGGYGGTGGYGGQYGRQGGYYPQQAAAATSVGGSQNNFQNRLNQIINRAAGKDEIQVLEGARIVPDERSNKLLIFANKRDMDMITNMVSKIDVLLAQVLIEAVIMEVKLGDSQKLGVSWAQSPRRFGGDFTGAGGINNGQGFLSSLTNFPGPSGFSYYGNIVQDIDVVVEAVAEDSNINIVSRPRIQTSHAIPGSFFIGETVPYITGFSDYGYIGSGTTTRSTVERLQVGLSLDVVPFITPEGLVVMEIMQNFDQRGRDVTIEGNPIPIINQRMANATLTVRDGQTIMMGGFISETKSNSKSGVPLLKDIPVLGALFRSKNNSNDRTELIILMRAQVLQTPELAADLATEERSLLPGVQHAEREFQKSDEKRQKKLNKPVKK